MCALQDLYLKLREDIAPAHQVNLIWLVQAKLVLEAVLEGWFRASRNVLIELCPVFLSAQMDTLAEELPFSIFGSLDDLEIEVEVSAVIHELTRHYVYDTESEIQISV